VNAVVSRRARDSASPRWKSSLLALALAWLVGCAPPAVPIGEPHTSSPTRTETQTSPKPVHHNRPQPEHKPAVEPPSLKHRVAGIPTVDMPNHSLTPGVAFHVTAAQVCVSGYASSVRNVSDADKAAVYARYGIAWVPYKHEIDHLISLELGGSNSIGNLWPEPYAGKWGATTKDALENRLHAMVCAGEISLRAAQHQEATNWVKAYTHYVGTPSSGTGGGGHSAGGYYASSYPSAHTIYCADDPAWRDLSHTYLVHFATFAAARRRFPSYVLHQPC